MARKVYNDYERINPPLEFVNTDGKWRYRMTAETATARNSIRQMALGSSSTEHHT